MVDHMKQPRKSGSAAKAETERNNPHVFNAGVCEQPFIIFLSKDNECRNYNGNDTKKYQDVLRKTYTDGGVGKLLKSQHCQKRNI